MAGGRSKFTGELEQFTIEIPADLGANLRREAARLKMKPAHLISLWLWEHEWTRRPENQKETENEETRSVSEREETRSVSEEESRREESQQEKEPGRCASRLTESENGFTENRGRKASNAHDHNPHSGPNLEPNIVDALSHALQDEQFDSPVSIRIRSYRVKTVDADGISAKAIIDGLVNCGLLQDDSTEFVSSVSFDQIPVKNYSDEKTEVVIVEVKQTEDRKQRKEPMR